MSAKEINKHTTDCVEVRSGAVQGLYDRKWEVIRSLRGWLSFFLSFFIFNQNRPCTASWCDIPEKWCSHCCRGGRRGTDGPADWWRLLEVRNPQHNVWNQPSGQITDRHFWIHTMNEWMNEHFFCYIIHNLMHAFYNYHVALVKPE